MNEFMAALHGKSESAQLQMELPKLQEQMAVMQHKLFGRSSEKTPHIKPSDAGDGQKAASPGARTQGAARTAGP